MTKDSNSMGKFLNRMEIVKNIGAIRRRGIHLEEPLKWLRENGKFIEQSGWYPDGNCCGYHEQFFIGKIGPISVRIAWANAEIGTPTLLVGVDSEKEWLVIRHCLRDAGFVR